MKTRRIFAVSAAVATAAFALISCGGDKDEQTFDRALLVGKWESVSTPGDFYRYYDTPCDSRGATGTEWYTGDSVTETDVLTGNGNNTLKWSLDGAKLTKMYYQVSHGAFDLPKYYTIIELTSTMLKYKDDVTGSLKSFVKR
ncbi:MAG: hypothetical protein LBH06_05740 [Rikenellaceae bacterium]|jgi:hypothetical protein|nr:hypothetical protein [Rikenellaceae bacterium]